MSHSPSRSVFIAADDDDRLLLQIAFGQHSTDCHLVFAEDGLALLDALNQEPPEPCLIILDLNMPRLNGFEALQLLRDSTQYGHLPIVILTTSGEPLDRQRAYALGANEFLTKPLNQALLGQTVRHLRHSWHLEKCL